VRVTPAADDRLIEVVAVLAGESPIVVRRSQQDVRQDGHSQFWNLDWTLDTAGTYAIIACVTGHGRGRCAEQSVEAH